MSGGKLGIYTLGNERFFLKLNVLGYRRKAAVSFIAGVLSVLSLPPFSFWPVLFVTFPMLFLVLISTFPDEQSTDGRGEKTGRYRVLKPLGIGWFFGFGYFVAGLYWMGHAFLVEADKFALLLPLAVVAMPAFLGVFYALAVWPALLFRKSSMASLMALVAGFGGAEWLRSNVLTGFPWNSIGYGLLSQDSFLQLASVFGIYGFNFITVFICLCPVVWFLPLDQREKIAGSVYFLLAILFIVTGVVWGSARLSEPETEFVEGVRFRIVQPNIPQKRKTNPSYHPWIFSELLKYSRGSSSADHFKGVTHVIWPEMAVPALLARDKAKQRAISELLPPDVHLISGSFRLIRSPDRNHVYNSLFVMDDKAQVIGAYDKIHLVPFGEYLPLQGLMEALGFESLTRQRGGFAVGAGKRFVKVPRLPEFSPLICYEIIFPNEVVEEDRRPGWLLNITNDAWFGYSTGPYQHLHQARVRAVEEGLPVIRVANTGVSAIIDARGRILKSMPLEAGGYFDYGLPRALPITFYAQWRWYVFPIFLSVFICLSFLFLFLIKNRRKI